MNTLNTEQMDQADRRDPIAAKAQRTPSGQVDFTITPIGGQYVLASAPFEILGPYEAHPSLGTAIDRMMVCADAVSRDEFPPTGTEATA